MSGSRGVSRWVVLVAAVLAAVALVAAARGVSHHRGDDEGSPGAAGATAEQVSGGALRTAPVPVKPPGAGAHDPVDG